MAPKCRNGDLQLQLRGNRPERLVVLMEKDTESWRIPPLVAREYYLCFPRSCSVCFQNSSRQRFPSGPVWSSACFWMPHNRSSNPHRQSGSSRFGSCPRFLARVRAAARTAAQFHAPWKSFSHMSVLRSDDGKKSAVYVQRQPSGLLRWEGGEESALRIGHWLASADCDDDVGLPLLLDAGSWALSHSLGVFGEISTHQLPMVYLVAVLDQELVLLLGNCDPTSLPQVVLTRTESDDLHFLQEQKQRGSVSFSTPSSSPGVSSLTSATPRACRRSVLVFAQRKWKRVPGTLEISR